MKQQVIQFNSGETKLEGIICMPVGPATFPPVILCHSHPVFGGNMSEPVMYETALALHDEGIASLRFNFRGTGSSEGIFDRGIQEQQDLNSAINLMLDWPKIQGDRMGLMGISFGAGVVMDSLVKSQGIKAIAVATPVVNAIKRGGLDQYHGTKLVITAGGDRISPYREVTEAIQSLAIQPSSTLHFDNADHRFTNYEKQLAASVSTFMQSNL